MGGVSIGLLGGGSEDPNTGEEEAEMEKQSNSHCKIVWLSYSVEQADPCMVEHAASISFIS
jgi:hypothetical protein